MMRIVSISLFATALCTAQSGCCCCRLPFAVRGGGPPIVLNAPAVIVNAPNNPPPNNPPPDNKPPDNKPPNDPPPNKPPPANNQPVLVKYGYNQDTGEFKDGAKVIGTGFSGKGEAKNDPASYKEPIVGIIPIGDWRVERRDVDPKTGEPVFDIKLFTGTHVKGRIPGEKFTIHADNSPKAGESGIAMPRNVRDAIKIPAGMFDSAIIEVRHDPKAPPRPKTYTYSQSTGQLRFYSEVIGKGYSGKGKGKNNPAMQDEKNVGPAPAGEYEVIMKMSDRNSIGFGSKLKLNPTGKFTERWPAEDIWIATESSPPGNHPAIFIVFAREPIDRIEYNEKPRTRIRVIP